MNRAPAPKPDRIKQLEAELRQHLPEQVFDTVIPRSVRVAEAPSYGVPVMVRSVTGGEPYGELVSAQLTEAEGRATTLTSGRSASTCRASLETASSGSGTTTAGCPTGRVPSTAAAPPAIVASAKS